MPKYTKQILSAGKVIRQKGQAVVLYRVSVGTYDPVNPDLEVMGLDASTPGYAIVLPASESTIPSVGLDNRILDDAERMATFRFVLLAALGLTFTPKPGDILRTGEGLYKIVGLTPLDPAGDGAILYQCGCSMDVSSDLDFEPTVDPDLVTADSDLVTADSDLLTADSDVTADSEITADSDIATADSELVTADS